MPTVGSSIINILGWCIMAAAIFSLLFMPPENFLTFSRLFSLSPITSSASSILSFKSFPLSPYKLPKNSRLSTADTVSIKAIS